MRNLVKSALAALCLTMPSVASADCEGADILDHIIGEDRAEFDTLSGQFLHGQGRFWEVTRDGKRSVLIGTYHLADPRITFISDAMRHEIENASILLVEVTRAEEAAMEKAMESDPGQILNLDPGAPRLRTRFDDADWAKLVSRAKAVDIPEMLLNIMQPWFLSMSLAMPPCALAGVKRGDHGLDWLIEDTATAAGVPVEGLETFEELFAVFSQDSYEQQIEYLKLALAMTPTGVDELETMVQLYLEDRIGEIWVMNEFMLRDVMDKNRAKAELAKAFEQLLAQRNLNWLDTLLPAFARGNAVAAVGALHLGSEDGLLAILEREGYTIKRLSLTP